MGVPDWFLPPQTSRGIGETKRYSSVTPFVDAEEYFADLRREVEATGQGGWILWIGFEVGRSTPMPVPASAPPLKPFPPRAAAAGDMQWFDVLEAADARGAQVRALLNVHPTPKPPDRYRTFNFDLVDTLNGKLRHCGAISDSRYLWLNGTHHQKLVLVYNNSGLSAYCGTCDVQEDRINGRWCEVQCKFTGEAAVSLYDIFSSRWQEHTVFGPALGTEKGYLKPVAQLNSKAARSGNLLVQVSTTYGNPTRPNPLYGLALVAFADMPKNQWVNVPHRVRFLPKFCIGNDLFCGRDPRSAPYLGGMVKQPKSYAFGPSGHTGIYQVLRHAIEQTKQFIYLEDQYLVEDLPMGSLEPLLAVLARKVQESGFKKLIILCTRIDEIQEDFQFTGWSHRSNCISQLERADKDKNKVVVCQYRSNADLGTGLKDPAKSPFYTHSKTWLFDDEFLVCGSANFNRRGYSHDSEVDFAVYDEDKRFVHDLRVKLWLRRLNTQGVAKPIAAGDLNDFLSAAKYWEDPATYGLTIENNRPDMSKLAPKAYPDLGDAELAKLLMPPIGPEDAPQIGMTALIAALKKSVLWDIAVDPDGT